MTKKIFAIFIFLSILFFSTKSIFADYAVSYQTYVNSTGVYQSAYNNYLTARANYLASGSLDSKDKAKSATLAMLQARDALTINYLAAINAKIAITLGMSDGDKSSLTNELNTEIAWYNAHNTKLTSAGSLEDLVSDSNDAKNQFNSTTQLAIYQSLTSLGVANNSYIRGELNGEINTLEAKIAEIKGNQDKDVSSIERNLIDVKNKISRSEDKDNSAKDIIASIKPTDQQAGNDFQDSQSNISDSNSYLKEANQGLLQIISQIKTN